MEKIVSIGTAEIPLNFHLDIINYGNLPKMIIHYQYQQPEHIHTFILERVRLHSSWNGRICGLEVFCGHLGTSCRIGQKPIHHHMSVEEIKSTFHVDSHKLVPEYEIVPIHQVERRSIANEQANRIEEPFTKKKQSLNLSKLPDKKHFRLHVFGQPFTLNLAPTEGLLKKGKLKLWTIEPNATAQHGIEYVEIPDEAEDEIGQIYQDEENQAAVLMRKEKGRIILEGSIGPHLVIRPLPPRLFNYISRQKKNSTDWEPLNVQVEDLSEIDQDTIPGNHHHIIYRRLHDIEADSDYALMEPDHISKRFKRSSTQNDSRKKRDAPYTIYPEILVIVDYDGYRLHGGDNLQVKRYFVSFWNGVDLRYKLLKGPKVRISIAGIIISRGRDATPYLERNRVGRDAIDSAAALTDMGKYLFRERRLPVYDIAVAITKYDMCRRRKGGRCTKGTAGFAYVGGACVVNKRLEKVNSVAIIEDTGGFSGIIVAAHEVGHLLGAVHDGSPPPSYLGGPGAEKCQWTDGYIMSDLRHTEKGFKWSSCSVASFHHFLNGDTATCLYNAPHEDESLPRVLPGKLLTLDAQCRRDRGTSACFKDDRVCAQLFCFDAGSGYCVAYRPAAEGSPCGDGQYCLSGRCVAEHENIIPDYSQNAPSYIRPNENFERTLSKSGQEEIIYQNPVDIHENIHSYHTSHAQTPPSYIQNSYSPRVTTPQQFTFSPVSTSKSQYDFNKPSTQKPYPHFSSPSVSRVSSKTNTFLGNYFNTLKKTTKSLYDFGNFGITSPRTFSDNFNGNIENNYLKRSYDVASYYVDSSNINKTVLNGTNLK